MKKSVAVVVAGSLLLLAGCEKKATGQVVAVVNGEEIGQQELNDEVQQLPGAAGASKQQLINIALDQIVTRKLLAQEAKKEEVDRTPEFVTRQRKLNDTLLIASMVDGEAKKLPLPTQPEIDGFVAAHPTAFAGRKRLALQSLVFPASTDAAVLQRLRPLHTLDQIAAVLTASGVQFSRAGGQLDTAVLPPAIVVKLEQLPPGEPFVLPQGSNLAASVITAVQPVPMTPTDVKPVALQLIRNQRVDTLVRDKLKAAKTGAKITYQSGFGPPAKPPGAPGAGAVPPAQ